MDAIFSHTTALEVFRRWDSFKLLAEQNVVAEPDIPRRMPTKDEVNALVARVTKLEGATIPLHVLVASRGARHPAEYAVAHLGLPHYPSRSFVHLAPGVACAGPELIALQMTEYATEIELLLLVDELCGHYGIQPRSKGGLVKRNEPLTSVERIKAFLEEVGPVRGARKLGRVLEYARDRSGSPQESRACHRFEFNRVRGGYEIKIVGLNDPVAVERAGSVLGESSARIRKPDLMLLAPGNNQQAPTPFSAVAVDYQGGYHRDETQQSKDIDRRNELLAQNVKDYEISKEHYDDLAYFDWLASRIRLDLGIKEPKLSARGQRLWQQRKADLNACLVRADGLHWTSRKDPLVLSGAREFAGHVVLQGQIVTVETLRQPA